MAPRPPCSRWAARRSRSGRCSAFPGGDRAWHTPPPGPRARSRYTSAATSIPISGPVKYTHRAVHVRAGIAEANVRAGFMLMPGERRLERDVRRHQEPGAESGQGRRPAVGDGQHHQHQHEGDRDLSPECHQGAGGSGYRHRVVDGGMGNGSAEPRPGDDDPGRAPEELRGDIERRIPAGDLPEPPEGQGHGRIEVGAGSAPPRRVDDRDCGRRHREPHEEPSERLVFEAPSDDRADRRRGVIQQRRENTGRNHEEPEMGRFHQVFGPVPPERLPHACRPCGLDTASRRRGSAEVAGGRSGRDRDREQLAHRHRSGPAAAWPARARGRPGRSSALPAPAGRRGGRAARSTPAARSRPRAAHSTAARARASPRRCRASPRSRRRSDSRSGASQADQRQQWSRRARP